jgi:tRNA-binding EMAP/Myf-like protein
MLSDQEVIEALERAGMEIEQISSSKPIDKKVIIALVKKVAQHPGADRLHLVYVTTGESEYRIVCGASNVRAGIKVALAQVGAVLPGGERIGQAKLRGELSEGMLCSERGLELGNDHNGIIELSSDVAVGTSLCDIYPADTVIDLKTPANRFDVLGVVGLAREVAAMTAAEPELPGQSHLDAVLGESENREGDVHKRTATADRSFQRRNAPNAIGLSRPLSPPAVEISADGPEVQAGALAERYMLARLRVDQPALSPRQVAARLRAAGMRSLGPVVDVYQLRDAGDRPAAPCV